VNIAGHRVGLHGSHEYPQVAGWPRCEPAIGDSHDRNDLTSLDHFPEGLAVGIFTDEAWVKNVPRVTR
jgi:hypothetical protein